MARSVHFVGRIVMHPNAGIFVDLEGMAQPSVNLETEMHIFNLTTPLEDLEYMVENDNPNKLLDELLSKEYLENNDFGPEFFGTFIRDCVGV